MNENAQFTAADLARDIRPATSRSPYLQAAYDYADRVHEELEQGRQYRQALRETLTALDHWYDARKGDRHPAEAALREAVRVLRRARQATDRGPRDPGKPETPGIARTRRSPA